MSDAVSNIEIEDVLSSIRRLVSDEARANERGEKELSFSSDKPFQGFEIEEKNRKTSKNKSERAIHVAAPALVLTPALRIEPEGTKKTESDASEYAQKTLPQEKNSAALILTQEDAVEENEENSSKDDSVEQGANAQRDQAEQFVDEEEHAPSEEYSEPNESTVHEMNEAGQAEVDFSAPDTDGEYWFHTHHDVEIVDENGAQGEEENEELTDGEPLSIEDKIAALKALISRSDSDFEPDVAEIGGNAGRPGKSLPWEDSQNSRVNPQSDSLPDPDKASQNVVFSDGAAAFQRAHFKTVENAQAEFEANASEMLLENEDISSVLDEDALRDMVAESVRQELQGSLGEQITRNIRKLVRREIYRALAANKLD